MGIHAVNAAEQLNLLVEGEFGHHGLRLCFEAGRVWGGSLGGGLSRSGQKTSEEKRQEKPDREGRNRLSRGLLEFSHDAEKVTALAGRLYSSNSLSLSITDADGLASMPPDGRGVTRITGGGEWCHCLAFNWKSKL